MIMHFSLPSRPPACGLQRWPSTRATAIVDDVACKNCKRTVAYRDALAEAESGRYTITLDREQATAILAALDLYMRAVGMGQTEALADALHARCNLAQGAENVVRYALDTVKRRAFGHPSNGSYAIRSPEVTREAKVMYDMTQVIRRVLAEERIAAAEVCGDEKGAARIRSSVDMQSYLPTVPQVPAITMKKKGEDR